MLSALSLSNVGNALYAAGRLTATTYGASCLLGGSIRTVLAMCRRKINSAGQGSASSDVDVDKADHNKILIYSLISLVVGVGIPIIQGNNFSTSAKLVGCYLGASCIRSSAQCFVGTLRYKLGIIPQERHDYFSASIEKHGLSNNIPLTVLGITGCALTGLVVCRLLGFSVPAAVRITALFYGCELMHRGVRNSIGLHRFKSERSFIPVDPYEVFSTPPTDSEDKLRPHFVAIIAGFAIVTLLGAQI
jgi:hypothetical protein